jgi:hypothetical protein
MSTSPQHPTAEQQGIVDAVIHGNHVAVTAMPGSGKSTVAYEIVRQCSDKNIVMIMFNRSLCDSTTNHLSQMNLPEDKCVKAFTFHGLVGSILGETCHNDRRIVQLLPMLKTRSHAGWNMSGFSVLIIDEMQDVRPGFFQVITFLIQVVCRNRERLRIVLLGDPHQLLYHFYNHNRADARFLTLGHQLFQNVNHRAWMRMKLTRSFRSTPAIARVLNALVPNHHMVPRECPTGYPPVDMYLVDIYKDPKKYIGHVIDGYKPEDIMILCSSLNERSAVKHIVRRLALDGVPVYVSRSGKLSDTNTNTMVSTVDGKVCVKTLCASKGLQAKLVIVVNRDPIFSGMNNSLYVGLSRSFHKLVIFHDVTTTSWDEVRQLSDAVDNDASTLRIHIGTGIAIPSVSADTKLVRKPCKTIYTDSMFSFVDPSLLIPLESQIRVDDIHTAFDGADEYSSGFDVKSSDGLYTNTTNLVGDAMLLALEFMYTGQIPSKVDILQSSTDPCLRRLYTRGMCIVNMMRNDESSMTSDMVLMLQGFAFFAIGLDSLVGFCEKVFQIDRVDFIMKPLVVNRFIRMSQSMLSCIQPNKMNRVPFGIRKSKKVDDMRIVSCVTLCNGRSLFQFMHRPSTDTDDVLSVALTMAVHGVTTAIIANGHTGEVKRIHLDSIVHKSFLQQAICAATSIEMDVGDTEFIRKFAL